jgi:septal ring factor EnvC (AmiA/AmiB activator)
MGVGILLKLLGVGNFLLKLAKGFFSFIGKLLSALMDWAGKHPLLAVAIAIDIVLLCGCWWGVKQHEHVAQKQAEIVQLQNTIQQKDNQIKQDKGLIDTLYERIKEYAAALTNSQNELTKTIQENNVAVERLKKTADAQLAAAQKQAEKSKRQRDAYYLLSEKYRHALHTGGTPEQRIASEEKINSEFIREFQGVR